MPEGDTLHAAAARVGAAILHRRLLEVSGTHRSIAREGRRLRGARVVEVLAVGKNLLVHTDAGWSLRTHLGMTGWWSVTRPGERWRASPGKARVVLGTAEAVAVCFAAPTVEIAPTDRMLDALERLGPDLVVTAPPYPGVVTVARSHPGPTVADLLLDQTVASGIGNVYKSEVLFLEKVHPWRTVDSLGDDTLEALYRRGHRLLAANARPGPRSTTGNRRRELYWVYGRTGEPCRRCGSIIEEGRHGKLSRITSWCPSCQPAGSSPVDPIARSAVYG